MAWRTQVGDAALALQEKTCTALLICSGRRGPRRTGASLFDEAFGATTRPPSLFRLNTCTVPLSEEHAKYLVSGQNTIE